MNWKKARRGLSEGWSIMESKGDAVAMTWGPNGPNVMAPAIDEKAEYYLRNLTTGETVGKVEEVDDAVTLDGVRTLLVWRFNELLGEREPMLASVSELNKELEYADDYENINEVFSYGKGSERVLIVVTGDDRSGWIISEKDLWERAYGYTPLSSLVKLMHINGIAVALAAKDRLAVNLNEEVKE